MNSNSSAPIVWRHKNFPPRNVAIALKQKNKGRDLNKNPGRGNVEFIAAFLWEMISLPKDPWIGGTPPSHNLPITFSRGFWIGSGQKNGVLEIPWRSVKTISNKKHISLNLDTWSPGFFWSNKTSCVFSLLLIILEQKNLQNTQPPTPRSLRFGFFGGVEVTIRLGPKSPVNEMGPQGWTIEFEGHFVGGCGHFSPQIYKWFLGPRLCIPLFNLPGVLIA